MLLAKPKLPPDFIDVSVGEPYSIKDSLAKYVELDKGYFTADSHSWEYPEPNGYQPLVKLLEDKYQAPVIITNGAKQALGAVFHALKKKHHTSFGMKLPYWALIPPLAAAHGLATNAHEPNPDVAEPYLMLAPNNPDGQCLSLEVLKEYAGAYQDANLPFIHDAAYFTHTYLPESYELGPVGDVQIYSASKMFGLSGLRLGWAVCYNESFAPLIQGYMEMMTVGVSTISQQFLYNLMAWEKASPNLFKAFESSAREEITKAKMLLRAVPKEVLEIPNNLDEIPGMFGWFKVGPKANFEKAKVNFIDGALFGKPGYVRMNLALGVEKMAKVVARLSYLI